MADQTPIKPVPTKINAAADFSLVAFITINRVHHPYPRFASSSSRISNLNSPFCCRSKSVFNVKQVREPLESSRTTVSFLVMAASEALIFLHVPKSAGTTLNRLIEWEYPLFEMYSVDPVLFRWSTAHLWRLPQRRLKRFRVFKGHMPFGLHEILPQPATYVTVMRGAVERVISAYYFMSNYKLHPNYWKFRHEGWTLEDFVRLSPKENVQTKMIAGTDYDARCTEEIFAKAKENLQCFSVIGLTERFEESLALMKLRFGWKLESYSSFNVTRTRPKKRDLPQSTLDLIAERNRFDIALYEFAAKLFAQEIDKRAAEIAGVLRELEAARIKDSMGAALFSIRAATRKAVNRAYSAL